MKMRSLPLSRVYGLLEPGPVTLVTTALGDKINVMTMSWHTMLDFEPPLIGCVISNRDHTFHMLKKTGACVIAIPEADLAGTVVKVGNSSGKNTDKFRKFGLTALPASKIKAPLIGECYANLECVVSDATLVGKYNFFILTVVKAWVWPGAGYPKTIHHRGHGIFMIAGKNIKLPSKKK
jgi:flavin reductase (DIM6/NTAB) family NADH-FMN oxidoreductase RutF